MKLSKFQIKNYRSCSNTIVDLHPKLTALIGINGAGKSNILNGVLLLRKILQRGRFPGLPEKESLSSRCDINFRIEYNKKIIYAKGFVLFETDERNFDDVQFAKINYNFKEFTGKSKWYEIPTSYFFARGKYYSVPYSMNSREQMELYRAYYFEAEFPKRLMPILSELGNFFLSINYFSASQFSDPSKCPVSIELEENRPIRKIRSNFGHEQFILDLFKTYEKGSKIFKRFLNTVGMQSLGLVENIEFQKIDMASNTFEIKTGGKIKHIERTRSIVVPNFQIDGNNLSPNQLSEGTLKTLALLFYTLTEDRGLLIIEEPEVCIHHGLLNDVMSIIKDQAKNRQIIISTHSDYVVDMLLPENILLVKKIKVKGTTCRSLTKTLSKNDFSALHKYLMESGNLGEYWKEGGFGNEENI